MHDAKASSPPRLQQFQKGLVVGSAHNSASAPTPGKRRTARPRCGLAVRHCPNTVAQRAPSTESLSAFAGVKRRRVRAGIFISAPVAGLRPMRALVLRLRKIPSPARRSDPSFFNSRTTRPVSSSSADLACFLLMPSLSARWAATCVCVIILLLAAENGPDMKRELVRSVFQVIIIEKCLFFLGIVMVFAQPYRFTGAGQGFSSRNGRESPPDGPFEPSLRDMRGGSRPRRRHSSPVA